MTALYRIADEYRAALAQIANLELPPEVVADTVEGLQGEVQDKLRAVVAYSLELGILADGAAKAAKAMSERAKALESRVESLRAYALRSMQETGIGEVHTDEWGAKVAKKPASVQIAEGAAIPAEFKRIKTTEEPDKAKLKAAIEAGSSIEGVSLVQGFRLSIK